MGCSVKEYTSIGENATIGAGSVVINDVESDVTVVGTPAEVKTGQ
jgi:acetyltransferase EpsM